MFRKLVLKNYKSFVDRTEIAIRPLTLIFGYNSSGKSTLLRSIPLIAASFRGEPGTPLSLGHESAKGASFSELTSELAFGTGRRIEIGIELEHPQQCTIDWSIIEVPDLRRQLIERFQSRGRYTLDAQWIPRRETPFALSNEYSVGSSPDSPPENKNVEVIRFNGLTPNQIGPSDTNAQSPWTDIRALLLNSSNVEWLTSIRSPPKRTSALLGVSHQILTPNGSNASDILAADWNGSAFTSIGLQVSSWYEKHAKRRIAIYWEGDRYRVMTEKLQGPESGELGARVNLADAGEGHIQLLPVLVSLAKAQRADELDARLVAFEEPESHLHPSLHPALAEEFCNTIARKNPPTIVVETHSENILLRIQRAIADGLSPDLVIVHWVRQLDDGRTQIDPVTFDDLGQPRGNWPPMVFAEDARQAQMLLQRQLEAIRR